MHTHKYKEHLQSQLYKDWTNFRETLLGLNWSFARAHAAFLSHKILDDRDATRSLVLKAMAGHVEAEFRQFIKEHAQGTYHYLQAYIDRKAEFDDTNMWEYWREKYGVRCPSTITAYFCLKNGLKYDRIEETRNKYFVN